MHEVETSTEYITTKELCRRLCISRSTVRRRGLRQFAVLIGMTWRFDWSAILRHLRTHGAIMGNEE